MTTQAEAAPPLLRCPKCSRVMARLDRPGDGATASCHGYVLRLEWKDEPRSRVSGIPPATEHVRVEKGLKGKD